MWTQMTPGIAWIRDTARAARIAIGDLLALRTVTRNGATAPLAVLQYDSVTPTTAGVELETVDEIARALSRE